MIHQQEIKNMRLISHNDLAGRGNIGEGMALQQASGGRRIMWLAHESKWDFTAVDVTDPRNPTVILQTDLPHPRMRSNSLALVGDILYVAHQTADWGLERGGVDIYDVGIPEEPRFITTFDTSGPASEGCHCLWCVDGHYAHLSTSMPDSTPRDRKDDQFYVIVDVSDPARPVEAGRYWIPGTLEGDDEPPPERHPKWDNGMKSHNVNVYPQRPDRAYACFKDAGFVILDISDMSNIKQISRVDYHPPLVGHTHTAVPLFDRGLMIVTDEAIWVDGSDWPKLTWVVDISVETNPVMLGSLPMPDVKDHISRPGRFGAHNVHENQPVPTSFISEDLVFGTYFNGGLRVHDITNQYQPVEVAYFIPEWEEPGVATQNPDGTPRAIAGINLNDVYVDENRLIYTADRGWGGLYILEMTI